MLVRSIVRPVNYQNLKERKSQKILDILEVIESDTQGPFPIVGLDGTQNNIKFIDNKSRYVKFETLPNKEAKTALAAFVRFQARMEPCTGKKIKNIRTDQGTEYMGEFLSYIEEQGIIKQKGDAYEHTHTHTHTHPGKAENVHATLMGNAKAMLKKSLLPPKFYNEAQETAAYLWNRLVHSGDTITPYEHIKQRKPDLSNLQPFGCVCYIAVPIEKRTKLDDTREKCRMIGYADNDDTEEMKGFKVIRELDLAVLYAKDVVFPNIYIPIFERLPNEDPYEEVFDDNLFGDGNYVPEHEDSGFSDSSLETAESITSSEDQKSVPELAESSTDNSTNDEFYEIMNDNHDMALLSIKEDNDANFVEHLMTEIGTMIQVPLPDHTLRINQVNTV